MSCEDYAVAYYHVKPLLQICRHLRCRIAKSVHPCTLLAASFSCAETSLLHNTSGIRAAAENAQRINTAWTAVVLCSSEFALQTRSPKIYMDVYFGTCLRFISARLLASTPHLCKRLTEGSCPDIKDCVLGRGDWCCGNTGR